MKSNDIVGAIVTIVFAAFILVYITSSLATTDIKKSCQVEFTDALINEDRDIAGSARFASIYRQLTRAQADEAKSAFCECLAERIKSQVGNARLALFKIGILGESDITTLKQGAAIETLTICLDATASKFAAHVKGAGSNR